MDPADVAVTNTDNDTAGITVSPTSGLTTTEGGGTATFTVVLTSQPTANVTVGLSSSNFTEGTLAPASVTFTPGNWNAAQTVTVTGADDFVVYGSMIRPPPRSAPAPNEAIFKSMDPADVAVTNTDNDTAGITVIPTSGLTTTEGGGTATFTLALTSQPTANVTIGEPPGGIKGGTRGSP